jgi:hypothetical protein
MPCFKKTLWTDSGSAKIQVIQLDEWILHVHCSGVHGMTPGDIYTFVSVVARTRRGIETTTTLLFPCSLAGDQLHLLFVWTCCSGCGPLAVVLGSSSCGPILSSAVFFKKIASWAILLVKLNYLKKTIWQNTNSFIHG